MLVYIFHKLRLLGVLFLPTILSKKEDGRRSALKYINLFSYINKKKLAFYQFPFRLNRESESYF